MSMLFVHFQNPQFEKWTISRVSGIFFLQKITQNQYKRSPIRQCRQLNVDDIAPIRHIALFRQKITQIDTSV